LLEGKLVNLKVLEKDDLPLLADWSNDLEFFSDMWFPQMSRTEWEKRYDSFTPDTKWFFIEKKDGSRIGTVFHFLNGNFMEIGYILVPSERRKGYGSEAVKIIVDYNLASHRVLEKAGFTKEGIIRKSAFIRGEWKDGCLYSILREEWKEPKILTKTR
jgi:RimJ/RimL family protein N-acetyltransferase